MTTESLQIVCPSCAGVNRVPRDWLADGPKCGRCKEALFTAHPTKLHSVNFDQHLTRNDIPVMVDFWGPWCGPCKIMAPVFEQAAARLEPSIRLGKLNTDSDPSIAGRYGICSIPPEIELASMVDRSLSRLLSQLDYQLVRFRNIYMQALGPREFTTDKAVEVHEVDGSNASDWSITLLDGVGYATDADRKRVETWNQMLLTLSELTALVAMSDGKPVGSASVMIQGSTAVLGGAATLPAFRRQGVQRALIEARLAVAARAGCNLAVVTADPGSSSGRNAE